MSRMKRSRGFTLIELLVVIAIIAVLASILFPVYATARAKSHQASCANNMRQVTTALLGYADDWQNTLPGLNAFGDLVDTNPDRANRGPLWSYIKNKQVFCCPAELAHRKPVVDPSDPSKGGLNFTYSMNGYMTIAERDRALADTVGEKLNKSRNSSRTILLVDENTDPKKNEGSSVISRIVNDPLFIWEDRTCDRHPGGPRRLVVINGEKFYTEAIANVCYLDSHLGTVPALIKWNHANGKELFYH